MIIEHRTYLDNSEEFYFFNSPKLKTEEDVKQLYKLKSPEYITHTPAKLYGRDEYNYYVSDFIVTPYDPEDGLIYPEHFKPTHEEFRTELIRLGIIFNNDGETELFDHDDSIKTAFNTATKYTSTYIKYVKKMTNSWYGMTANTIIHQPKYFKLLRDFKAWRELKFGKDGERDDY